MGVEYVGVYGFFYVIYSVVVGEALDEVTGKERFGSRPVSLAGLYAVGKAPVGMCKVVESYVHHVGRTIIVELHYRHS